MPVIDLRGRKQERQAQMLMMMQQFRNRSTALSGGETELERVEKEIAEAERKRAADERAERTAEAGIKADVALERQRQSKTDVDKWKAGQENILKWEEEGRKKKELEEGTLPLRRAQTEEAQAGTEFKKAQTGEARARTLETLTKTQGERDENRRKADEAILGRAEKQRNLAYQMATMDQVVDKTGADRLEEAERLLQGNPGYVLPRNPDGSWKAPDKAALGMLDKDGNPTAKFAESLDKIQEPNSGFGKLMDDAAQAKANGAPPWVMDQYKARWVKESAMTTKELEGSMVKPFLDRGDYEGAQKALAVFRNPPTPKMPSAEERQEFARQGRMTLQIQDIQDRYNKLKSEGRIPVGRVRQPMLDAWAAVGTDDAELQALRKDVNQMMGEYVLYLSGRAATDAERADIRTRIPSLFDSQQTFEQALPAFQGRIKTNISVDAGLLYSLGYKIPDNIPVLPLDEIVKQGPVPNVITETGFIPAEYMKQHIKGIGVLGREGKVVGGLDEWRQKGGPPVGAPGGATSSETEEPPMSTESDAVLSPEKSTNPKDYSDVPRARGLLKERERIMNQLSEGQ